MSADRMETYCLLAKQATGKALVTLIQQAISSPALYSFSQLLEAENIQGLHGTEFAGHLKLLKIFSYGTYEQYKNHLPELPTLQDEALKKLKCLSLVSIASESHHLPYAMLQERLELTSTRALEDLVISASYASLLKAKLNTREQVVYIESTSGRDVHLPDSLDSISTSLDSWCKTCDAVLAEIQDAIAHTTQLLETKRQSRSTHEEAVRQLKAQATKQTHRASSTTATSAAAAARNHDPFLVSAPDGSGSNSHGRSKRSFGLGAGGGAGGGGGGSAMDTEEDSLMGDVDLEDSPLSDVTMAAGRSTEPTSVSSSGTRKRRNPANNSRK